MPKARALSLKSEPLTQPSPKGRGLSVLIRGDGIAAACCAHLLQSAGIRVAIERIDRPRVPAVMLSDTALALIRDVFGRPDLFADRHRIDQRVVAWGGAEPVAMPHGAVVVSDDLLIEALSADLAADADGPPDFTILTSPPLPAGTQHRFGSRQAVAARVMPSGTADPSRCVIEALAEGWLFLVPNGPEATWLLGVGTPIDRLLAGSRLIAPQVTLTDSRSGAFDTCPRLAAPTCGADWLACGTAAIAFDPICGDGTAQAVREAILAAAVVTAIAEGGDATALLSHYDSMLVAAMRRHLKLCADFYRTGGTGPWWQAEHDALAEGHHWCTARLATVPEPRYRLEGFRLVAREGVV